MFRTNRHGHPRKPLGGPPQSHLPLFGKKGVRFQVLSRWYVFRNPFYIFTNSFQVQPTNSLNPGPCGSACRPALPSLLREPLLRPARGGRPTVQPGPSNLAMTRLGIQARPPARALVPLAQITRTIYVCELEFQLDLRVYMLGPRHIIAGRGRGAGGTEKNGN